MSYTPTLVLRKVDPAKIVAAYQAGTFRTATLPNTRIYVAASAVPSTTGQTTTLRDNNNCLVVLHLSNKETVKALPTYRPRCFWCMQDLETPCPVATSMTPQWADGSVRRVFEASDVCCSYECALAYARHFLKDTRAEIYTRLLHHVTHPGAPALRYAPDFRLLDSHGGTMTVDEFKHSKTLYVPLPSVVIQPLARTYMAQ